MATVKLLFRTEKANAKGEVPLYIRITKHRKHRYVALGIRLTPDQWNAAERRVRKGHRNHQYLNRLIADKLAEAEGVAASLEGQDKAAPAARIRQAIMGSAPGSLLAYADRYVQQMEANGQHATAHRVKSIFTKLRKYLGGRDLTFDGLTVTFLKGYERHLREELGNSVNTTHANLKVLRRLVNEAVREDLLEHGRNPFLRYRLKQEKTAKQFLTEEELELVEGLDLEEGSLKAVHRDMYVFACYAGGLRISDLLLLRWRSFDGERVAVGTRKTGSEVSVRLPARALAIIVSYLPEGEPDPEGFVFPILSRRDKDYNNPRVLFRALSSENAQANKSLREIAAEIGLGHGMNFHSSRHTWATRAVRKGMRIEYVSRLMGHASIKTTQIYAQIVAEELDRAMGVFD